jgi:hypothetical protein
MVNDTAFKTGFLAKPSGWSNSNIEIRNSKQIQNSRFKCLKQMQIRFG